MIEPSANTTYHKIHNRISLFILVNMLLVVGFVGFHFWHNQQQQLLLTDQNPSAIQQQVVKNQIHKLTFELKKLSISVGDERDIAARNVELSWYNLMTDLNLLSLTQSEHDDNFEGLLIDQSAADQLNLILNQLKQLANKIHLQKQDTLLGLQLLTNSISQELAVIQSQFSLLENTSGNSQLSKNQQAASYAKALNYQEILSELSLLKTSISQLPPELSSVQLAGLQEKMKTVAKLLDLDNFSKTYPELQTTSAIANQALQENNPLIALLQQRMNVNRQFLSMLATQETILLQLFNNLRPSTSRPTILLTPVKTMPYLNQLTEAELHRGAVLAFLFINCFTWLYLARSYKLGKRAEYVSKLTENTELTQEGVTTDVKQSKDNSAHQKKETMQEPELISSLAQLSGFLVWSYQVEKHKVVINQQDVQHFALEKLELSVTSQWFTVLHKRDVVKLQQHIVACLTDAQTQFSYILQHPLQIDNLPTITVPLKISGIKTTTGIVGTVALNQLAHAQPTSIDESNFVEQDDQEEIVLIDVDVPHEHQPTAELVDEPEAVELAEESGFVEQKTAQGNAEIIDLHAFAKKVPDPALALTLLEHYAEKNQQTLAALTLAIKNKQWQQAQVLLNQLHQVGELFALQGLQLASQECLAVLTSENYADISLALLETQWQIESMQKFVEQI